MRAEARALGFDAVGVTHPGAIGPAGGRLLTFLEAGRHGGMGWMAANAERRGDPRALWPEARSILMAGASYAPDRDPLEALSDKSRGAVSVYAQSPDYHDVLKGKLRRLAESLVRASGGEVRVFVDTAPLMEKPLAAAAGIGWQGKHTNLVSRTHGSWLFLGALLTTAEIAPDAPEGGHCGTCRRCLDICPTAAFPAPYQLDARRCLAYLTIEHKGHIAAEFRRPLGNRVFGCDDCLAVCPWNKFARAAREAGASQEAAPLADLIALDGAAFRARFRGTPVKRTGRDRFVRNALVAAGNSGDAGLVPKIAPLLADASSLVRAMAVWALRRLAPDEDLAAARRGHLAGETDPEARMEWDGEEAR